MRTKPFRDEYQGLPSDPFANLPVAPVKQAQFMSWDPKKDVAGDEGTDKETVMDQEQLKETISKGKRQKGSFLPLHCDTRWFW